MGMYTRVTANVRVKPEMVPVVAAIVDWQTNPEGWSDVAGHFPELPWLRAWAKVERADFIPRGGCTDHRNLLYAEGDVWWWAINCELKNYSGTIEHFLENVLPQLAYSGTIETLYCEHRTPSLYEVLDGRVAKTQEPEWEEY